MTRNQFDKTEKLYHYTSFESALKIIESNKLLFNPLKKMNDINELYRPIFLQQDELLKEKIMRIYKIVYSHQQISLSRDLRGKLGFDIPSMWGHYADKGQGLCLIFDKTKLLKCIPASYKKNNVRYVSKNKFDSSVIIKDSLIDRSCFTNKEYKEFFFKKTNDWSYEQEYRVLVNSDSCERVGLDFKDALLGVIAHHANEQGEEDKFWTSVCFKILEKHCNNVYVYESFMNQRHLLKKDGSCLWATIDPERYALAVD